MKNSNLHLSRGCASFLVSLLLGAAAVLGLTQSVEAAPASSIVPSLAADATPTPIPTWAQTYGTGSYNYAGQPVYDTQASSASGYDAPASIAPMPDGGVVVGGELGLQKLDDPQDSRGRTGAALVRYDRNGRILWQQLLRQNNDEIQFDGLHLATSMIQQVRADAAGNIFAAGQKRNSHDQNLTAFVAKFSADGALIWQNGFDSSPTPDFPTGKTVGAQYSGGSIIMDLLPDGGVVIGTDITYNPPNNGLLDAPFLAKFNADGSRAFEREFETNYEGSGVITIMCRRPDADGYALLLSKPIGGNSAPILILTDSTGNPVFQRIFQGTGFGDSPLFITPSTDGGYFYLSALDGNNGGGVEVRKLKADLTPVWRKLVRHFNAAPTLTATSDGGCLLVGQNYSTPPRGNSYDVLLVSLDGSGNVSAAHDLGGYGDEGPTGDYRGGTVPVACLTTDGGMAFSVATFSYPTSPGSKPDWWIVKTDANGQVAGYSDNMFDLPASSFGEFDSDEAPSTEPGSPFGPGTSRSISLTPEPQLVLEDLDNEIGINKPTIKNQTVNPIPTPVHGGLSGITFAVDESDQPTAVQADSVLRFRAVQNSRAAGLETRVQTSTDNGATWKNLADGTGGQMSYISRLNGYVLNSKNYPTTSGVYFRATEGAGAYGQKASNPVGPFDLTSSVPRLSGPVLFVGTNGPVAPIHFGAKEEALPSGIALRIQASQTPADEASWIDAPIGNKGQMTQDMGEATRAADPRQFYLTAKAYPATDPVYFRAIAVAPGYADALSFPYGPFTFIEDPPAKVQITLNGVATSRNDIDTPYVVASGSFSFSAKVVSSGRSTLNMTLLYDGITLVSEANTTNVAVNDYRTNIPGDHIVEAYAIDDLGVTGAAVPIHVRVLPAAPGRVFTMVQSGDWNNPANWSVAGDPGVPGANDFAILGGFSPTISGDRDVTVNAISLNGGTIQGTKTLVVTSFGTIAAGNITGNLTMPSGSTLELLNDKDIGLSGRLRYSGTLRLHGNGGIGGVRSGSASTTGKGAYPAGLGPDFDVGGFFHGILEGIKSAIGLGSAAPKLVLDLPAGGHSGSSKQNNAPPANAHPPTIEVASMKLEVPVVVVPSPATKLVSQDGGGLVAQGPGTLVAQGAGNLVAQGAGNLVAQGAGNLVAQGAGNLVAQGAGNALPGSTTIASNSTLISQDGGGLLSQDGGGLVAQGAGNIKVTPNPGASSFARVEAATDVAAVVISDGETNLDGLTITGPVILNGGILSGSGFIFGDLASNGGYLSPGHSAGALAVMGNFTQGPNGTLILEDGGALPTQFDALLVSGTANLGGRLDLRLINHYQPDPADTFNPLSYTAVSGMFSIISSNAQVSVNPTGFLASVDPSKIQPSSGQPLNIATRMSVQAGDNVLIAGFIITGPSGSTKKVLIRGLGPSLAQFGVPGTLSDPLLELHDGNTITTNDNWQQGDTSQIPNGFAPSDSREAVIVATLAPGNYSAVVKGAHGETGVGIAEVYDLDSTSPAKLGNIATRGFINTGDDVMIGGFIVGGNEPAKILVRAIGPTLSDFGVQGALQDPTLELHDSNGMSISNDDWRESQEADIIATTIPPNKNQESAILATLAPGNYTAVVRGKNNTTGIGLVEAYNLQ